mgnify:CR=1 FL=1
MTVTRTNHALAQQAPRRLRRRSHRAKLVVCVIALLVLGILSFTPAKSVALHVATTADESFLAYRLMSERDALLAANQQLKEEVEALKVRTSQPKGSSFEASVRAKLDELQSVIAAATELDLSEDGPVIASKGSKGKQKVASSLKGSKAADADSRKKLGVGGKELDCERGNACSGAIRKQNIALEIGPSFYGLDSPKGGDSDGLSPTHRDLKRRVESVVAGLRALPIGYPAAGDVTSHYGFRISPFSRGASFHEGMDISLDRGEDVLVTGDGIVTDAKYDRAYGWMIDVTHSSSVVSRYAHLSKTLVRVGQSVERGQRIALSGNTGRSTGPHLHYEVRVNGRARNPKAFALLPQKLAKVL